MERRYLADNDDNNYDSDKDSDYELDNNNEQDNNSLAGVDAQLEIPEQNDQIADDEQDQHNNEHDFPDQEDNKSMSQPPAEVSNNIEKEQNDNPDINCGQMW